MDTNINQYLSAGNEPLNPLDLLEQISEKKEKEVSLSTLSQKQIKKIMASADNGLKVARQYYQNTIEPKVITRKEIYSGDKKHYQKKFPRLDEKTQWVSRDTKTTFGWMLPSLLEPFCGNTEPVDIKGVNIEDDEKAKQMQQIASYQLKRKNDLDTHLKFVFQEAGECNFGITKVWWKHEEDRELYKVLIPSEDYQAIMLLVQQAQAGEIEIKKIKPLNDAPDLIEVHYEKIKITANHVVLEYIPPFELLFTPEAATLQSTKFVAHRKIVTGDYLKRKEQEGIYKNVDEAIKNGGNTTPTTLEEEHNKDINGMRENLSDNDIATKRVELLECYIDVDYNNDGIYEKLIVHMVGDVPLRISENDFGFVPFFTCCLQPSPTKVFNEEDSFAETIEPLQDIKTAIMRQAIINIANQNAGQCVFDPSRLDIDALIEGDQFIAIDNSDGKSIDNYIYALPTPQLQPYTMNMVEYIQNEIEAQTGSTRYNQGLDSNSLNKTARGMSMIMGQADKRIKLIARDVSESYYIPIMRATITLIQKYFTDGEIIRLNNEMVQIRKEDLDIDYDFNINVGEGAGTRENRIEYLMGLNNQIVPQWIQLGIANDVTTYNVAKDLLEEMGLRGTIAYLQDPTSEEAQQMKQQQQQMLQQQQAMQQAELEKQHQLEMWKILAPKFSGKYIDLPIGGQQQLLRMLGVNVDATEMIAKEMFDKDEVFKAQPHGQEYTQP